MVRRPVGLEELVFEDRVRQHADLDKKFKSGEIISERDRERSDVAQTDS